MPDGPVPAELRQFIARYIQSVEQLGILCLLVENPNQSWSEAEIFHRIQSSQESVSAALRYFAAEGFLAYNPAEGYRVSPKTAELDRLAGELVKTYRGRRVSIVEAIYKVPEDSIRHFADAFKLRKDKL